MKKFVSKATLTKDEKNFIKISQEDRKHFPMQKNENEKNISNNK